MTVPDAGVVLIRHGDVGVKSAHVQAEMEGVLADRVAAMLDDRGIRGTIDREWGRLFVRTADTDRATAAVTDVFGVHTASPARSVPPRMDAIADALATTAEATYDGGSFAVEARRTGDHDFSSHDVGRLGGEAVWAAVEDRFEPRVDLDDPDHTFFVEVRDDEAFVFREKREGPGGFPLGTQAPLVALVSGGIDSPVAAWFAMRRGAPVIPLYLDLGEYGGADHRARALSTIRTLSDYAPEHDLRPRVVDAEPVVDRLVDGVDSTRMLSYRRFMYRVAEHVAERADAAGIVTGEALGQKSSQTARNLNAVDRATTLPIHRPLLARDKQEIVAQARRIGTFEDSTVDAGCDRVAPDKPATRATVDAVETAEPDDLFALAKDAAASLRVLDTGRPAGEVP
ncbi:MAG: tRNA sulfurtransferase [Halanaeroarchaeum sp.]